MPDRSPDRPPADPSAPPSADPTRDIRLPPLPDSPGPSVRPEWASYVPVEETPRRAAAVPAPPSPPPADSTSQGPDDSTRPGPADSTSTAPTVVAGASDVPAAPPASPRQELDPPTDRHAAPADRPRSSTLTFQPPPPVQLLKVSVGPRRRNRLMWTVLILLPLLVIAGSGIWLFVLLSGG